MKITALASKNSTDVTVEAALDALLAKCGGKRPVIYTRPVDTVVHDWAWKRGLSYTVCHNATAAELAHKARNLVVFGNDRTVVAVAAEFEKRGLKPRKHT